MQETVERKPDGTWPPGQSGNPAGFPRGEHKLGYWLKVYLFGGDMSRCPPKALEWVKAAVGDSIALPPGKDGARGGCPTTRKEIIARTDGGVAVKIEGLSEQEIQDRLVRMMTALRERLPEQYHAAITEAARAAMVGEGEDG